MRQALNAAYAALAGATEDVDELDRELRAEPKPVGQQQSRRAAGITGTLTAFGKMRQKDVA